MWRCKSCGMIMSTREIEKYGGFCNECRND